MSMASRAMGRLRELYSLVWRKNQLLNQQRENYPAAMHRAAVGALLESLEPRILLSGTTFVVNSLADVVANDGVVTLREAIQAANTNAAVFDAPAGSGTGTDIITFDQAALQAEAGAGNPLVITLGGTELQITDDLEIQGLGADILTIDAQGNSRVFFVGQYSSTTDISATFNGMTLTGGDTSETSGNHSGSGSAICGSFCDSIYVVNSILTGNNSNRGTIYGSDCTITVTNSLIVGNTAEYQGGGIKCNLLVTVTNSTIAGNWAGFRGGGIYADSILLNNSIVSGNESAEGDVDVQGPYVANNSLIGGNSGFVANPSSGVDGIWGTDDDDVGDLHLTATSTAVNFGDNDIVPADITTDLGGNPRVVYGIVDAGVYEYQGSPAPGREVQSLVVTTTEDVIDAYDGKISLREALQYEKRDESMGGVITFDASLSGEMISLNGNELLIDSDVIIDASSLFENITIDGNRRSRVFRVQKNISTELVGLTISGGFAEASTFIDNGGGIFCELNSTVTIIDSKIISNEGNLGAIYADQANLTIQHSEIINNFVSGVYCKNSILMITDSISSYNSGRGIYYSGSEIFAIKNSIIAGNSTGGLAGANIDMSHCLVIGNVSHNSIAGGGVELGGVSSVTNSIITGNAAMAYFGDGGDGYSSGGGIYCAGTVYLNNSIVWGNSASKAGDEIAVKGSNTTSAILYSDHSIIGGGLTGSRVYLEGSYASVADNGGNLADDPMFIHNPFVGADGRWGTVDDDYGDLRPQCTSPMINAGNNALIPAGATTDFRGEARIVNGAVDIGLYEYDGPEIQFAESRVFVAEGGDVAIGVKLTNQPTEDVVATLALDGDSDITMLSTALTFTTTNWDTYQYVTVSAAEDEDRDEGQATLTASAAGLLPYSVNVTEVDDEPDYVVDTLVDEDDGDYSVGDLSLREAIRLANEHGGLDEIIFDQAALQAEAGAASPLVIALDELHEITQLVISDDVIITGLGADILTIDAGGISRVFGVSSYVSATIQDITITGGSSGTSSGGGISAGVETQIMLIGCNIIGNVGTRYGGGIYGNERSIITVIDSFIAGNKVKKYNSGWGYGGGIAGDINSSITVINSVLVGNYAYGYDKGHAIYAEDGTIEIVDSTITGNSSIDAYDYAIYCDGSATITANNSIIARNGYRDIIAETAFYGNNNLIGSMFIMGGTYGNNNQIGVDPAFVRNPDRGEDNSWGTKDDDYGDLRLTEDSLSINAGNNAYVPADITADFEGNPRIVDGTVDIGAYEFNGPEIAVSTDSLWIHEGRSDTFAVSLTAQPDSNIEVTITQAGDADLSADTTILTFTPGNWDTPQTVTISSAVDADSIDGWAKFTLSSGDIIPQTLWARENEYEYIVDTLVDEDDGDYSAGDLSLREAIRLANETPGEEDISFDQVALQAEAGVGNPLIITLVDNQLKVTEDVNIFGLGAENLIIDADGHGSVFYLNSTTSASFDGLTITGAGQTGGIYAYSGKVSATNCIITDNAGWGIGGYTPQRVFVSNCTIVNNQGSGIKGGTVVIENSYIAYNTGRYGQWGGGVTGGTITVENSIISNNTGRRGGGIYGGSITIIHSEIIDNKAIQIETGDGIAGGIYASTNLSIIDSTINGNSAVLEGGGIYADRADVTLVNSIISGNTSFAIGGGIYLEEDCQVDLQSSIVVNNIANQGGGVYADNDCVIISTNSTITGNVANERGGGLACTAEGSITLNNSIVSLNQAYQEDDISGGYAGSHNLIGVDPGFARNPSFGSDGWCATADDDYGDLRLLQSGFAVNAGDNSLVPADVTSDLAGNPRVLEGTVDIGAYEYNGPEVTLSQSSVAVVEGQSKTINVVLTGRPDDDVVVTITRTEGDDDLSATSPTSLTFTPDNWDTPQSFTITAAEDADTLSGTATFTISAVGMADQILHANEVDNDYIVDTLIDEDDGDYSAGDLSLREAISLANTIPGKALISFDAITLQAQAGAGNSLIITLNGTQLEITDNLEIHGLGADVLTIDANNFSRVFYADSNTSVVFSGLTITGGKSPQYNSGGGIAGDTITIIDSNVINNYASESGGGILAKKIEIICSNIVGNTSGDNGGGICGNLITVSDSLITKNMSLDAGGGIYCCGGTITVSNTSITDNVARDEDGGGIYGYKDVSIYITNSIIQNNKAQSTYGRGGGIFINMYGDNMLILTNSMMLGNIGYSGGGIFGLTDKTTITNSVIMGNRSRYSAGGIYISSSNPVDIVNSTICDNITTVSGVGGVGGSDVIHLNNSIVTWNLSAGEISDIESYTGSNNLIGVDPGFYRDPFVGDDGEWGTNDDEYGDLRLLEGSAAINAGNNDWIVGSGATDLGGTPRIIDGTVDIGAYEFNGAEIVVSTHSLSIKEGENKIITVALTNRPDSDVIVNITRVDGDADLSVLPTELTFTLDTWDIPQEITISAAEDADFLEGKATFAVSSNGVATQTVIATEKEVYIVDTLVDEDDGNYFVGDLSLREAIRLSNERFGSDIIVFNQSALQAEAGAGNPIIITLTGTQLEIKDDLEICGLGANVLRISTYGMNITDPEGKDPNVLIRDMKFTGGKITNNGGLVVVKDCICSGARVENVSGQVDLENCIIRNNAYTGVINSGKMNMVNCTVSENTASNQGGGIYNSGVLSMYGCIVRDNVANGSSQAGAGIMNRGRIDLVACEIVNNRAKNGWGGGISSCSTSSNPLIVNIADTVIAGNYANYGGGIHTSYTTIAITNSTVAGNAAWIDAGIYSGSGAKPEIILNNSIVALNHATNYGMNISGSYETNNSLIGMTPGFVCDPNAGLDGVWGTTDDDYGDLHLRDTSLVINMGDNTLAVDEQGSPLTEDIEGNPRISDGTVDIGAYEFQGPPNSLREAPSTVVTTLEDIVDGGDGEISLREAILHATLGGLGTAVTFDSSLAGGTISLLMGTLYIDQSLTFDASGIGEITIDDSGCPGGVLDVNGQSTDMILRGVNITGSTNSGSSGGIHFEGNNLTLTDCTVYDNDGGGINFTGNILAVSNCDIHGNEHKGGITVSAGTLLLSDSTVSGNLGGGIHILIGCSSTIMNCIISGNITNSSSVGGGISSNSNSSVVVMDSLIANNWAYGSGGGIYSGGTLNVLNSRIVGNTSHDSGSNGGGINGVDIQITNSIIACNSTVYCGGGVYSQSGTVVVTDSTITGNHAYWGGGICQWTDADITINNSIVALNEALTDDDVIGAYIQNNSLVGVDPAFVRNPDDGGDGWGDDPDTENVDEGANDDFGDLHLRSTSIAINLGDNTLIPAGITTDLGGALRVADGTVDAGAYEYQGSPSPDRETPGLLVTTAEDVFDVYDGMISLREALWYNSQDNALGNVITFSTSLSGQRIVLNGYQLSVMNDLRIDASMLDGGLTIDANQHSRVFSVTKDISVEFVGLTITGGSTITYGGGIYGQTGSSIQVIDSAIIDNTTGDCGGGIYGDSITLIRSDLTRNFAQNSGGGIYGHVVTVKDSAITRNASLASGSYNQCGAGIFGDQGSIIYLENTKFLGNASYGYGSGIYALQMSSITIIGSDIVGNTKQSIDIYTEDGSSVVITNSTLCNHFDEEQPFGIYADSVSLKNSIIVGEIDSYGSYITENCLMGINPEFLRNPSAGQDGLWGTSDDDYGDLRIRQASPAYNAGDNTLLPAGITTDIAGNPRIVDGAVDIGAHEFNGPEIYIGSSTLLVYEGTSNTFTVELTGQPDADVTINVQKLYGDADLMIPPTTLLFTPSNWDVPQNVTVTAAEDEDVGDGQALLLVSAAGMTSQSIVVMEVDNEPDYLVDTLVDEDDGNYSKGNLSLREAITLANNTGGEEVIGFDQAALQYEAGAGNPLVITLNGSALYIYDSLTILGLGADILTIDAAGESQVFVIGNSQYMYGGEYVGTITFDGLTITGGYMPASPYYYYGFGGGISANCSCNITVLSSKIVGNSAMYGGGIGIMGMYGESSLLLVNTVVAGNTATYGGGIYVNGSYWGGESTTIRIENSTIAGNYAQQYGGIAMGSYYPYGSSNVVIMNNSIVALNESLFYGSDSELQYFGSNNIVGEDPGFVRNPSDGGDGWFDDSETLEIDESANNDYGDLHLAIGSMAIDSGDNALLPADEFDLDGDGNTVERLSLDMVGNQRIVDGDRNGTAFVDIGAYEFVAEGILNRQVFYNNSRYDGFDSAANVNDDAAIAPDKVALLPGQTATFANYTSYSKGINGIMIDMVDMMAMPTANDFIFKVGNSNDPDSWVDAPAPASITLREGDGMYNSARITITWADNAIEKQWLQVTVLSDANGGSLGLAADDVFYFGNAIGETGTCATNAIVNASDEAGVRNHPAFLPPATIDNVYDFNRDMLVNASDQYIARMNTTFINALRLITVPEYEPTTAAASFAMKEASFESINEEVVGRYVLDTATTPNDVSSGDSTIGAETIVINETKQVLLPGQVATAVNYTTDNRGLTGIVIDILNLPCTPVASDFVFRMGNTPDISSWLMAPEPERILISEGDGIYGSDRVTLLWAECDIENTWLEVTVLSDIHGGNLGMAMDDVFYFGNRLNDMTELVLLDLSTADSLLHNQLI